MNAQMLKDVSGGLSNHFFHNNMQATNDLMKLFDKIFKKKLEKAEDYIKMYNESFYTFKTWDDLVKSELMQSDGLTEKELEEQIGNTVWRLGCGWYVQYV